MQTKAKTVDEYLNSLPEERKTTLEIVRQIILDNLPDGYEEVIQYDMISYIVPFERFPETYNKQPLAYISLGNQKNHMALYMNGIYSDPEHQSWFVQEYRESGKRLDMGKSCVRFRKLDHLPLEIIAKSVAHTSVDEFIALYENAKISAGRKKK
ncbi:MAG: DUF1801 domain-containing protein [Candidatus Heimdallarchaeota archaeon]|nr:DUF1801 domain-containing protein [Candidatus Heimdallarchaeota archaeon]